MKSISYEVNGVSYSSTIDHLFWNASTGDSAIDAGVLHLPDNLSDHSPVFCIMNSGMLEKFSSQAHPAKTKTYPCWKLATDSQKLGFYNELQSRLQRLKVPSCGTACTNAHCKNEEHKHEIDSMMLDVLHSLESAADIEIPKPKFVNTNKPAKNIIPKWDEEISPYKEDAYFWHSVWTSAGKPLNNNLHMTMKRTRNAYHLKIRKNKRMLHRIKKNAMLQACLTNNGNLFTEIRRQRKCKRVFATTINGQNNDIPSHFAKKYKRLCNSVDDEDNISRIEEILEGKITQRSSSDICQITTELLKTASQN